MCLSHEENARQATSFYQQMFAKDSLYTLAGQNSSSLTRSRQGP